MVVESTVNEPVVEFGVETASVITRDTPVSIRSGLIEMPMVPRLSLTQLKY